MTAVAVTGSTASAAKPTAAVAVGDSFVSGEGAGNYQAVVDRSGIAQGYQDFSAPNDNAYFCHRSANAEINVAELAGINTRFNIACSGGIAADIASPSSERTGGRNVDAQLTQLRAIGETHDIDLVLIGLGANELDFTPISKLCIGNFLTDAFTGWWEPWINIWAPHSTTKGTCGRGDFPNASAVAEAEAELASTVREILDVLDEIDADGTHRVVIQDYVNPMPQEFHRNFHEQNGRRDTRDKFRALARERYAAGCPIHRGALPLAHDLSEDLGTIVENVHDQMLREYPGADLVYLNVQKAFDGARLCETAASPTGALHTPTRAVTSQDGHVQHTLEGNKLDVKKLFENCMTHFQRCQETWHPNAAGHAVLGQCLTAAWRSATPLVDCSRSGGQVRATSKAPSVNVDLSARVIETLDRRGGAVLEVSGSYSARLNNAPGLSVRSVRVTATDRSAARLPSKTSMSGTYTYRLRCQPTTINLRVSVELTLSDGQIVNGSGSYRREVSNCGGNGGGGGGSPVPIA